MAVIGKIRDNSILILIFVGLAMVAFVATDTISNLGSGNAQDQNSVGEIAGFEINRSEFQREVDQRIKNSGQQVTENLKRMIENQVWNSRISQILYGRELKNLGLTVPAEEQLDLIQGENIHPWIKQFFAQPNKKFDINDVKKYLNAINDPEANEDIQQRLADWQRFESEMVSNWKQIKVENLITKSTYVNSLEAENRFKSKNDKANFSFVVKKYNNTPDSLVSVSESDIKAYYNDHKDDERYQQEKSVDLSFAVFDISPSAEDSANTKQDLEDIAERFRNASNDSVFVVNNTDAASYRIVKKKAGELPSNIDQMVFNADSMGGVYGPYVEDNYMLSKLLSVTEESEIKARHILIKPKEGETNEDVKEELVKMKNEARSKNNFADLAKEKSEDSGSSKNGGDLGWFTRGTMVGPFENACFSGNIGDMPIVETDYGVHLIEIIDKRTFKQAELAVIERNILPSSTTKSKAYTIASDFSTEFSSVEEFEKGAEESEENIELVKQTKVLTTTPALRGIPNSRKVIQWGFDDKTKIGEISQPYEINNKIIIACLSDRRDEGTPSFNNVADEMEIEVVKDKKATLFLEEMKGYENLEELASSIESKIENVNDLAFERTNIPGAGDEPEIIGKIFSLNSGEMSLPIKGHKGVYVVKMENLAKSGAQENYSSSKDEALSSAQNSASTRVIKGLQKALGVKDERYKFN